MFVSFIRILESEIKNWLYSLNIDFVFKSYLRYDTKFKKGIFMIKLLNFFRKNGLHKEHYGSGLCGEVNYKNGERIE